MPENNKPSVWIGCLGCYNEGRLVGEWYELDEATEVTFEDVHNAARLDPWGQSWSVAALVALAYSTISAGEPGWSIGRWGLLALGFSLLAAFVLVERGQPQPMLPVTLFRQARFTIASVVGFCLNVSFFGQLFALSLFFQDYLGYSPFIAGLALAPQACSAVFASPLGGRSTARVGTFPTMLIGLLAGAAGFGSLALINGTTPYALMAVLTFVAGFGMAFAMPAATSATVSAAPRRTPGSPEESSTPPDRPAASSA